MLCLWIQNLRSGSDSVFTYHLSCEHVTQAIGNEQHFVGMCQCGIIVPSHCIKLEEGIEIHELNSGDAIHFFLVDTLFKILFHHSESMWVAISTWITQNSIILANENKIDSPGVDTNGCYGQLSLCCDFQPFDNLEIKGINVPIETAACLYQVVVKTCEFLQ